MATMAQVRDRGNVLHVQVGSEGCYSKLDVPRTEALLDYIAEQQENDNTVLSLAGPGNHNDYVPIAFDEETVTRTVTEKRLTFYPVAASVIDSVVTESESE